MPRILVDSSQRPPYRRRALMRAGQEAGLWEYESENPAGYVDADGVEYDQVSFTVRLPRRFRPSRLTLLASEVDELLEQEELTIDGVRRIAARRQSP